MNGLAKTRNTNHTWEELYNFWCCSWPWKSTCFNYKWFWIHCANYLWGLNIKSSQNKNYWNERWWKSLYSNNNILRNKTIRGRGGGSFQKLSYICFTGLFYFYLPGFHICKVCKVSLSQKLGLFSNFLLWEYFPRNLHHHK